MYACMYVCMYVCMHLCMSSYMSKTLTASEMEPFARSVDYFQQLTDFTRSPVLDVAGGLPAPLMHMFI